LRHELNEAEQINIGAALRWTNARKRNVLDRGFLSELHRRMFGTTSGRERKLTISSSPNWKRMICGRLLLPIAAP